MNRYPGRRISHKRGERITPRRIANVLCAWLLVAGCGNEGPGPAVDASPDAAWDVTSDVPDAAEDVAVDTEPGDIVVDTFVDLVLDAEPRDALPADTDFDTSDGSISDPGWRETLATSADFDGLAAGGTEVKYLARIDGREPPSAITANCLFQDMGRWAWHIEFLRTFDGLAALTGAQYAALVLNRATRSLWGGGLVWRPNTLHPLTGARGIHAWSVYGEARPGSITATDIIEVHGRLSVCASFAADTLVFVAAGVEQQQMLQAAREQLADMGIATLAQ